MIKTKGDYEFQMMYEDKFFVFEFAAFVKFLKNMIGM